MTKTTPDFFEKIDAEMLKIMRKNLKKDMRVRDKIALGVTARLQALTPHRDELLHKIKSLPPQQAFKNIWRAADLIWWEAGDTATDYNHYSKRILLCGVMASTTLYWLNTNDKNMEKTNVFLDHRINDILKIGGMMGKLKSRTKTA